MTLRLRDPRQMMTIGGSCLALGLAPWILPRSTVNTDVVHFACGMLLGISMPTLLAAALNGRRR